MNVAPPTRTRSVTKNRVLAAAYAGAHRFGVEVFEPATTKTLMAALLVHDLHTGGGPEQAHPWQDEARAAAHGGLWRVPYAPRSALGLAALLGYTAARNKARQGGSLPDQAAAGYSLLRTAIWYSSGSFGSAARAAIRTPIQASARPYPAAHSTSTGIRTAAGSERVSTTAIITGMTASTVPKRLPRVPASR